MIKLCFKVHEHALHGPQHDFALLPQDSALRSEHDSALFVHGHALHTGSNSYFKANIGLPSIDDNFFSQLATGLKRSLSQAMDDDIPLPKRNTFDLGSDLEEF